MFHEMMAYLYCLEHWIFETLLLFFVTGSFILPSVTCQTCHDVLQMTDPRVEIVSSPSSNTLPFGAPLNLTCIASQNDELPDKLVHLSRPVHIQWFGPEGPMNRCQREAVLPPDAAMRCLLMVPGLTLEQFGNYTCQAASNSYCSIKRIGIYPHDIQGPEFVNVPVSQTASIGSTVTFNCTVTGHPKPTITWTKENESHSVQSSLRAKIITDDDKGLSQLVITGVTSEDYGKYQCVANNSAGVKESQVAYLYPKVVAPSPSVLKQARSSKAKILAVVVPSVVVMMICGLGVFLCHRRSRRARDAEIPLTSIACPESVERISLPCELTSSEVNNTPLREDTGNTFDPVEGPAESPKPFQEYEKIQLPGIEIYSEEHPLLGQLSFQIPARTFPQARQLCPIAGLGDTPPKRPPKPRRKESTEHKVLCSCVMESRSREPKLEKSDTLNSKDSGYDSSESRENICLDQEINECWEIDLSRLEVKSEVLGEGHFGIVHKGQYRRDDGSVVDVAVKQLKDSTSETNKADLLGEMQILKQAGRHPNIVSLVGGCTQEENILVVTELIPRGNLESLLRSRHVPSEGNKYANLNCEFNDRELLQIALQIASGMQHLEERKCIHRDLAARNVFIDDNKVAKVGDFGLARDISDGGIYTKTSNGKVPWRWSSLESLRDGIYTSQSDVWSFGILLWEITTYGELPYPDITTPSELICFLSSGKRMPRPDHCCKEMYDELISSCWKENPWVRPTFAGITKQLEKCLKKEYKRTYVNIKNDDFSGNAESWL